ncbi:MAG: TIGR04283 family arsenosugar biosynthesis glycosyltransferase [Planctomycetota bacterium]
MSPLFSVIIPTWNEAQDLPDCLQRLSEQNCPDFEVIVCDAGSHDQTLSIAHDFGCKILNGVQGRSLQMNQGAKLATGEILLFLHADTKLSKEALQSIRELMFRFPKVPAGAFYVEIDAPGWLFWCITKASNLRSRLTEYPYGDQGIFVKRSIFQENGGFPEVRLFEEVLFFRKIRALGRIGLIRKPQIQISARRWIEEGIGYTVLRNTLLTFGFYLGVNPNSLAQFYQPRKPHPSFET